MNTLLRQLWAICRLHSGPQDLPYAPSLARNLILLLLLLDFVMAQLLGIGAQYLPRSLMALLLVLLAPWLLLRWRGLVSRYVQTLLALVGTTLIVRLLSFPVLWYSLSLPALQPGGQAEPGHWLVALLSLAVIGWKLLINGHIYRHALNLPFSVAMLIAFSLFLLQEGLGRALVGGP